MTVDMISAERRRRIRLAIAAYAYEFKDDPIMSDGDFDKLALEIDPEIETGNKEMDEFFKTEFDPHTGMWIHKHPNKKELERYYINIKSHEKNADI